MKRKRSDSSGRADPSTILLDRAKVTKVRTTMGSFNMISSTLVWALERTPSSSPCLALYARDCDGASTMQLCIAVAATFVPPRDSVQCVVMPTDPVKWIGHVTITLGRGGWTFCDSVGISTHCAACTRVPPSVPVEQFRARIPSADLLRYAATICICENVVHVTAFESGAFRMQSHGECMEMTITHGEIPTGEHGAFQCTVGMKMVRAALPWIQKHSTVLLAPTTEPRGAGLALRSPGLDLVLYLHALEPPMT